MGCGYCGSAVRLQRCPCENARRYRYHNLRGGAAAHPNPPSCPAPRKELAIRRSQTDATDNSPSKEKTLPLPASSSPGPFGQLLRRAAGRPSPSPEPAEPPALSRPLPTLGGRATLDCLRQIRDRTAELVAEGKVIEWTPELKTAVLLWVNTPIRGAPDLGNRNWLAWSAAVDILKNLGKASPNTLAQDAECRTALLAAAQNTVSSAAMQKAVASLFDDLARSGAEAQATLWADRSLRDMILLPETDDGRSFPLRESLRLLEKLAAQVDLTDRRLLARVLAVLCAGTSPELNLDEAHSDVMTALHCIELLAAAAPPKSILGLCDPKGVLPNVLHHAAAGVGDGSPRSIAVMDAAYQVLSVMSKTPLVVVEILASSQWSEVVQTAGTCHAPCLATLINLANYVPAKLTLWCSLEEDGQEDVLDTARGRYAERQDCAVQVVLALELLVSLVQDPVVARDVGTRYLDRIARVVGDTEGDDKLLAVPEIRRLRRELDGIISTVAPRPPRDASEAGAATPADAPDDGGTSAPLGLQPLPSVESSDSLLSTLEQRASALANWIDDAKVVVAANGDIADQRRLKARDRESEATEAALAAHSARVAASHDVAREEILRAGRVRAAAVNSDDSATLLAQREKLANSEAVLEETKAALRLGRVRSEAKKRAKPPAGSKPKRRRTANAAARPECHLCPITYEVMTDPVVAADGVSYERSAIEYWFTSSQLSPLHGNRLETTQVFPNHTLKQQIQGWDEE